MKKIVMLVFLVLFVSCEDFLQETDDLGENAGIIGTWVQEGYEDDVTVLARSADLDSMKYGFIIREDGTFTERKNAGWCETAPISYGNYDGAWEALSDSLLEITVDYWGGAMNYQMRIVFLDQARLGIRYLYADNRMDNR